MNWLLGITAVGAIFPKIGDFFAGIIMRLIMIFILGVAVYQYDKHVTEYDVHYSNFDFVIADQQIHGNTITIEGHVRNRYEKQLDRIILEFVAEECNSKGWCYTVGKEEVTIWYPFKAGEKTGFVKSFNLRHASDDTVRVKYRIMKARADRGWF